MPKLTPANEISVEKVSNTNRFLVHGPYATGYGRPLYGWLERDKAGRYAAIGIPRDGEAWDARRLGSFAGRQTAIDTLAAWAAANLTPEALEAEFESKTAGGIPLTFLRRTSSGIVAVYRDPKDGRRAQTAWMEDGTCTFTSNPTTPEEKAFDDAMRLVRRAPEPVLDVDDTNDNASAPSP